MTWFFRFCRTISCVCRTVRTTSDIFRGAMIKEWRINSKRGTTTPHQTYVDSSQTFDPAPSYSSKSQTSRYTGSLVFRVPRGPVRPALPPAQRPTSRTNTQAEGQSRTIEFSAAQPDWLISLELLWNLQKKRQNQRNQVLLRHQEINGLWLHRELKQGFGKFLRSTTMIPWSARNDSQSHTDILT